MDVFDDIFGKPEEDPNGRLRIIGPGSKVRVPCRNRKVAYEDLIGVVDRVSTRKIHVRMVRSGRTKLFDSFDLEVLR